LRPQTYIAGLLDIQSDGAKGFLKSLRNPLLQTNSKIIQSKPLNKEALTWQHKVLIPQRRI
jgi:hypothetical protein